ncbi:MAG: Vitamin B12 transporter BtuB [Pseudomonadales bacterium]|nr:Vitamin B12 transporter BtuB [Pseudomonadales bacterium]
MTAQKREESLQDTPISNAAVGIYVDGVFLGRASGLATAIADLERVEVLRGPQGTLYGRNTTGGAINMITTRPGDELAFRQKVSLGNRDLWLSQTTLNVPVSDTVAARASYLRSDRGGWVSNHGARLCALRRCFAQEHLVGGCGG